MDARKLNFQPPPLTSVVFKSSSKVTIVPRKDLEAKLVARAFEDLTFKKSLLADPRLAIQTEFSLSLPDKMHIVTVEETASVIYFILPHNPYDGIDEGELVAMLGMNLEDIAGWVMDQHLNISAREKRWRTKMVANAWRVPSFKKLLLEDPRLVFENEIGTQFPDHVDIIVAEETADKIFLVIPHLMDTFTDTDKVEAALINMPIVIGSHADSTNPVFGCDRDKTTHADNLFCLDTRAPIDECKDTTSTSGFNGC